MHRPRRIIRLRLISFLTLAALLAPGSAVVSVDAAAAVSAGAPAHAATAAGAASSPVLINEVAAGSSDNDADSFFELRNVSDAAVDLSGWQIFRCSAQGLRANSGRPEVDLTGVVLDAGAIFTAGHVGMTPPDGVAPDAVFTQRYSPEGFGLYLQDPEGALRDAIGVYPSKPWPTQSECSGFGNVPNTLAVALDESWQRVGGADDGEGDGAGDASGESGASDESSGAWQRVTATPGAQAASSPAVGAVPAVGAAPAVRISEVAAGGPAGWGDDIIELHNEGSALVSLGGWVLYRCTALGVASADTVQIRFDDDDALAPDERLLIGGPGYEGADADLRMRTSLATTVSGVLLTDADGVRVDGVTISNHPDTACQTGDEKLASVLDYRSGESWQRDSSTGAFAIASRTPGAAPKRVVDAAASGMSVPAAAGPAPAGAASIAISEFATDPAIDQPPAGYTQHNFVELGNYGEAPVDISGWKLIACGPDGFRRTDTLATVAVGTKVAPGETWLAALEGTTQARTADAVYAHALDFLGAGVWIQDRNGERIDRLGVYHANEMDFSIDRFSECRNGMSPATFAVDRLAGETFQRTAFDGVDADDFTAGVASPGQIDDAGPTADLALTAEARARIAAGAPNTRGPRGDASRASLSAAAGGNGATAAPGPGTTAAEQPARVLEAFTGTSTGQALATRSGSGETRVSTDLAALSSSDDAYDFPYVRLRLEAGAGPQSVSWSGTTAGRGELRLSVWSERTQGWRLLAVASASTPGGIVNLTGEARADEVSGGTVDVLVQSAPRLETAGEAGDGFADPDDYDFAISHITDTQYLSEAYPDVYAELAGWVIANQAPRKIAFATHTGDLIQNWVDSDQNEDRARFEFERASEIQAMLDDAGVPNSVLPGNHDNKRGVTNDLFNEYFSPARYAEKPWYGGSIAPGDNSANFSTFEAQGARFLMLSLPYAYGEREIAWAEDVVAQHPNDNVVLSTHEHVTPSSPDSPTARSVGSRWVSRAGQLFERVIAPNRNVVLVLSGHFHGLGRLVTENAGGIEGHTVVELLADYQEFRTDTGERATGFQRLLQVDLGAGSVTVDTFSSTLGANHSFPYDYPQVVPENGDPGVISNTRPWNVLKQGLQNWYSAEDDDFEVRVTLQYPKSVVTQAVSVGSR